MPRHVSSPRMLSWRQRTAIAAPILLLAGVAAFALTGGDDDTPTASETNAEVSGLSVATTDPIATQPSDPRSGSSGPGGAKRDTDSEEPERDDDHGRADRDDDSKTNRDPVSRDDDSDHGTSPAEKPNRDDENTIDPDTDDADGGSDNGSDNGNNNQDHSDEGDTDEGDSDDGNSDEGNSDPTTPPDGEESDEPDTVDRAEAIRKCRRALSDALGAGGLSQAIDSCVENLVGTPLARVDSTLNRTVDGLLGDLGNGSSDDQSGEGLLCSIFGTCRD